MSIPHPILRATLAVIGIASLVGCASFSADGGFQPVSAAANERLGKKVDWQKTGEAREAAAKRVAELLAKPLGVDDAVQVALLNNRGLQANFAELAISEADLVQAGRFPNPSLSMLRASAAHGSGREYGVEQGLSWNLFSLVTMPQVRAIEQQRFVQVQHEVTLRMLRLAADVRTAYYTALAAEEALRFAKQVSSAAEAGAELARRMAKAGNFNKLQQAREQGFYADAAMSEARAEQMRVNARERLIRLLGLWGQQTALTLPERLPDLPASVRDLPNIEQQAMDQRLDLKSARMQLEALAKQLGLSRSTRFINALELGAVRLREGEADAPYKRGFEVSFELPLFDWGDAKVLKAEAVYMQALDRAAEAAINARSEVREAYYAYRSGHDMARHYRDEILPIKKRISEENLLRYNGMLIGVFELLADARSQITCVTGYIDTLRDFWIAQSNLDMALVGKPDAVPVARAQAAPDAPSH